MALVRAINVLLVAFLVLTGAVLVLEGEESSFRWLGVAMLLACGVWLTVHVARLRRGPD